MSRKPLQLLVSIRNTDEVESALCGGADIIDIKEPANGPLGMANRPTILSIVRDVAGRAPISAALGELTNTPCWPLPIGLHYVKLGLSNPPANWPQRLQNAFARAVPAQSIAVAYADHLRANSPPVEDVLQWSCDRNAAGLLVDTAVKDDRKLFDWIDPDDLQKLIDRAHRHRLLVALAGSLSGEQFSRAMDLEPDIIAVRGAACVGHCRRHKISQDRVRALADLIEAHNLSAVGRED